MKFNSLNEEIQSSVEAPFANCKMARQPYAKNLACIVKSFSNSKCVISLSAPWGMGKTTFLKMWENFMRKNNFPVIHFNAWESDYAEDPIIPLIGEFQELTNEKEHKSFTELAKSAGQVGLAVGATVLKNYIGIHSETDLQSIYTTIVDSTAGILQDKIVQYKSNKKGIEEFKTKLSAYISDIKKDQNLPLIYVVDELDRCNPKYAVKVLERIKHLFDVNNICFIIAINREQMESSIKGFYGTDNVDASNYLRRFFDIDFLLPSTWISEFTDSLYEKYNYNQFFSCLKIKESPRIENDFKQCISFITRYTTTDLRTIERVFLYTRIVILGFNIKTKFIPESVFLLSYLHVCNINVYNKIANHEIDVFNLIHEIKNLFPMAIHLNKNNIDYDAFYYLLALIAHLYLCRNNGEYVDIETKSLQSYVKDIDDTKFIESYKIIRARYSEYSYSIDNDITRTSLLASLKDLSE